MDTVCIYGLRIHDRVSICTLSADRLVVSMVELQKGARVFRVVIQVLYRLRENFGLGSSQATPGLEVHQNRIAASIHVALTVCKRLFAKQKITCSNSLGGKQPSSSPRGFADLDGH